MSETSSQHSRSNSSSLARWAGVAVGLFLIAESAYLGWRLGGASAPFDDAFITFRYARNFAEGLGFAYNAGGDHLGTTAPAFAFVLGMLQKLIGIDPEQSANWLSAASLAVAGWAAFHLVLADFGLLAAVAAVAALSTNSLYISFWGVFYF